MSPRWSFQHDLSRASWSSASSLLVLRSSVKACMQFLKGHHLLCTPNILFKRWQIWTVQMRVITRGSLPKLWWASCCFWFFSVSSVAFLEFKDLENCLRTKNGTNSPLIEVTDLQIKAHGNNTGLSLYLKQGSQSFKTKIIFSPVVYMLLFYEIVSSFN